MTKSQQIVVLACVVLIILGGLTGYVLAQRRAPAAPSSATVSMAATTTAPDLATIFDLKDKEPGTQLYYSDTLGVGFTYLSNGTEEDTPENIKVTQTGNTIYVHTATGTPELSQDLEVFTKNPNDSFETAIQKSFSLTDYPNCKVEVSTSSSSPNYEYADLTYPSATGPDDPFWENVDDCPSGYGAANYISYFLYNPAAPDRFLFVMIGQYPLTNDGVPENHDAGFYGYNWDHSIRILK